MLVGSVITQIDRLDDGAEPAGDVRLDPAHCIPLVPRDVGK
jgi:hypothetical protein